MRNTESKREKEIEIESDRHIEQTNTARASERERESVDIFPLHPTPQKCGPRYFRLSTCHE